MLSLWLRNLVYWTVLICLTLLVVPVIFLCAPFPRRLRHRLGIFWACTLVRTLEYVVGLKYQVIGKEHIPHTPSLICSKHQSGWETMALQAIFPAQVYVAKRELVRIPFFGWGFALMNPIIIDRAKRAHATEQILQQGRERVQHDFWITIFPEGTRVKPGQRGKYKLGAARLAYELKIPLLPVAHNAGEFWPRNAFLKYPGLITVVIGPALKPEAFGGADELMAAVEAWIEARQDEITGVGPFRPNTGLRSG